MIPLLMKNGMWNNLLDIIFPKNCINCGKEGTYLCEDCLSLIEINPYYYCLCNKPRKLPNSGKCPLCKNNHLDGLMSACSFDQKIIKEAVHKIKYNYVKELSLLLSFLILTHLHLLEKDISGFSIVPVPLSVKKKKRRGFNQSWEMAKAISETTRTPLLADVLLKIKDTRAQVDLNREERMENIKDCFRVTEEEKVRNKKIFLLDDVYTTGSTMNECAKVLKAAGAKEIVGLTVAREVDQPSYFV